MSFARWMAARAPCSTLYKGRETQYRYTFCNSTMCRHCRYIINAMHSIYLAQHDHMITCMISSMQCHMAAQAHGNLLIIRAGHWIGLMNVQPVRVLH